MYDQIFNDIKTRMQPALDLAETNKKMMEQLIELQKVSTHELVNASLEQFKALSQVKEPKAALDLQVAFYKDLESKMTAAAEKSIAVISEAKDVVTSTVEASAKQAADEVSAAVKKATGKAA
ncbi:phasin family protein [Motiliproteus sp. SC1-56]|uniref:phasin family protein n=1 Tax=Motiliproteus sp. SC1-56 TaxID=2799565 RepID=UPI001A8E1462|nr:phasin family protein [Motiliproteus sp. SC1-56]